MTRKFQLSRMASAILLTVVSSHYCLAQQRLWDLTFVELRARADQGEVEAHFTLGQFHERARNGAPRDFSLAMRCYESAAKQGHGRAMHAMARLYEKGLGAPTDIMRAVEWYKKAVEAQDETDAPFDLMRLSRTGKIKDQYLAHRTGDGRFAVSLLDMETPTDVLVAQLGLHTELVETGKRYVIGYNDHMYTVAARGKSALPALVQFVKRADSVERKYAGILTIHLIGIESQQQYRFREEFKVPEAREALRELMKVEGLTDMVTNLLKRDPWPTDVPEILDTLEKVRDDCPSSINALLRYPLAKRPIDTLSEADFAAVGVEFEVPREYTDRSYARLAIEAIQSHLDDRVTIEPGALDALGDSVLAGNGESRTWRGTIGELVSQLKDFEPTFSYCDSGRPIYYYVVRSDVDDEVTLHFCTAATAKQRLISWWKTGGRTWYLGR